MTKMAARFLWFCSGATTSILKECPVEHNKYAGIGATILFTAMLASLSGGYALYTVFGSVAMSVGFGVFWGIVIFNLDRVIVSGMRRQDTFRKELLFAVPRVVVAVLLAMVITKPLELTMFAKEIKAQIDKENLENMRVIKETADRAFPDIETLKTENRKLEDEITKKVEERDKLQQESVREAEGTAGTGKRGKGPVYREKKEHFDRIETELGELRSTKLGAIENNKATIAALTAQRDQMIQTAGTSQADANSLLARIKALGDLADANSTIRWTSLLLTLLFICLEVAPVSVKLLSSLSRFRPYDDLLESYEYEISETAKHRKAAVDNKISTNIDIMAKKEMNRLNAEVKANEELMTRIASAQAEIASQLVDKWKERELETLDDKLDQYVVSNAGLNGGSGRAGYQGAP